jgi:hypothetical protein
VSGRSSARSALAARGWTTEQDQDARVVQEKIARHLAERASGVSCVVHGDQRPPAELVEVELLLGEHHRRAPRAMRAVTMKVRAGRKSDATLLLTNAPHR